MKDAWDFFWEQIIPIIGLRNFAIVEFLVIVGFAIVSKYYFDQESKGYQRELAIKDATIQGLNSELENAKQYRVDILVQRLTQRVKSLTENLEALSIEKETEQRQRKTIEQEKVVILKQLETVRLDVINLKERLKSFDENLSELIDDYCENCTLLNLPDEEHPWANFIIWGSAMCKVTGDENLVSKVGYCNYCTSPQIKCGVCGSVNSINLGSDEKLECVGGCGVIFTVDTFVEDKSMQYSINVSRLEEVDE